MTQTNTDKKGAVAFVKVKWWDVFDHKTGFVNRAIQRRSNTLGSYVKLFTAPTEDELNEEIKRYCEHNGLVYAETVTPEEFKKQKGVVYESHSQV